ncbi:hypothetical protein BVI1335_700026 [Burkholderia vietnamiensis]|nr:hypothetical protein BVI1335_700026 [Burkholderia vietnamiensis]
MRTDRDAGKGNTERAFLHGVPVRGATMHLSILLQPPRARCGCCRRCSRSRAHRVDAGLTRSTGPQAGRRGIEPGTLRPGTG